MSAATWDSQLFEQLLQEVESHENGDEMDQLMELEQVDSLPEAMPSLPDAMHDGREGKALCIAYNMSTRKQLLPH